MAGLKLSTGEVIERLGKLEWADRLSGIVAGMMFYRADSELWGGLLEDWSNGNGESAEFAECQGWADQYSANTRERWSGESRQEPGESATECRP